MVAREREACHDSFCRAKASCHARARRRLILGGKRLVLHVNKLILACKACRAVSTYEATDNSCKHMCTEHSHLISIMFNQIVLQRKGVCRLNRTYRHHQLKHAIATQMLSDEHYIQCPPNSFPEFNYSTIQVGLTLHQRVYHSSKGTGFAREA